MAWNGATRAGERDEVESVAVSLVELKLQLHRTRALHLQLQAAVNEPRKEMRESVQGELDMGKKTKWDDPSATPLDQSYPLCLYLLEVNFRHEVNANISETPVGLHQRRNTLREPDADVLQLQQLKTNVV